MISVLLKPKLLAIKNRWRAQNTTRSTIYQDLIILIFCFGLMALIYTGTSDALKQLKQFSNLAYLPSSHPLGLILVVLLFMLLVSNAVIAIGTLFLSNDLDLLLSSPVGMPRFFWGKLVYILVAASWMPFMFMAPFLIAFGVQYDAHWSYYLIVPVLLIPYFVIPTALAIIISTLFTILVPANRTKEVLLVCLIGFLFMIYQLIDLLGLEGRNITRAQEILRIVSMLSMPAQTWLPSHWVANCLRHLLEPNTRSATFEFILLFCSGLAAVSLAYLAVSQLHSLAHSKARNMKQEIAMSGRGSRHWLDRLLPFLPPSHRALIGKEYKVFARELTQAVQLAMLLGLGMIYLYNLRIFRAVESLPDGVRITWQQFLFIGNIAMGAFITTAVCTRFVFPSISLEGPAYWILSTSPFTLEKFIRTKFWFWLVPIACISSTFFAAGAYTIGAPITLVILNALCAWIICYGIVGIGIGCGAYFAQFDWEYSSQLAASFGSFVYMLISIFLILCSVMPSVILIAISEHGLVGGDLSDALWLFLASVAVILLCLMNYLAAGLALKVGERALLKRMD